MLLFVAAVVTPFVAHTLLLYALQKAQPRVPMPGELVLGLEFLIVCSGLYFINKGWPQDVLVIAIAYFPMMLMALSAYTVIVLGPLLGSDSL